MVATARRVPSGAVATATAGQLTTIPAGGAEWAIDSTASGVLFAENFQTAAAVAAATFAGGAGADHIVWDTTTRPPSGGGWAKDLLMSTDGADNGSLRFYIAPDHRVFGPNQTSKEYFIRWSEVNPSEQIFGLFPGTAGPPPNSNYPLSDGSKHFIGSSFAAANPSPGANAVVVEDMQNMGCPRAYYYDGASLQPTDVSLGFAGLQRLQSGLDNGTPTGTDAVSLQHRYGPVYNYTPANSGTPSADNFGFTYIAGEVVTFEIRVKFGASFNNCTIEGWAAHQGQVPVRWLYNTGITLGNNIGGHDGFWLTSYNTGRSSMNGVSTYRLIGDIIASTQPIRINGHAITPTGFTPLETVAAGLSVGQWGTLTASSLTQQLMTQGVDSGIMPYAPKAVRDDAAKKIYFYGGTHDGTNGGTYLNFGVVYDEATNTWSKDADGPQANGIDTHGYHHLTIDPNTGTLYMRAYGSATIYKKPRGGSWSVFVALGGTQFADFDTFNALEWHPGLYSAGGLVHATSYLVTTIDVTNGASNVIGGTSGVQSFGSYCNVAARNRRDGNVYFGGGGAGATGMWRVIPGGTGNRGVIQSRAAFPVYPATTDGGSFLFPGAGTSKMMLISNSGAAIYEYDEVANTWSSSIGSIPFTGNTTNWYFGAAVDSIGALLFVASITNALPSTSMHIWKR